MRRRVYHQCYKPARCGTAVILLVALMFQKAAGGDDSPLQLDTLLQGQDELVDRVLAAPAKYQWQILYTQVDRGPDHQPQFTSYSLGVDEGRYFYPASTVKLPAAALALEKLNRLGIDKHSTMVTDSLLPDLQGAASDVSAPGGKPSVAHYIKKVFLVSDNDAYNRLYEFVGQHELNDRLQQLGFLNTRLLHRLGVFLEPHRSHVTNPVSFLSGR